MQIVRIFAPPQLGVTTIINILKLFQLCRNLLFQLKTKTLVAMLSRLILSILSMALEIILNEFLRWALLSLWIRLKKKIILLNLKLKLMKTSNFWKIVIGAVSAALGYILNAIGL
jgi:general stress protein CsbA